VMHAPHYAKIPTRFERILLDFLRNVCQQA
jgi:hypothetical protein